MKFFTKTLKTLSIVSSFSLFAVNTGAAEMKDNCKGKSEAECMKKGDMTESSHMKEDMKSDHMKKDGMMEKGKMKGEEMKDNMMKKEGMKK